MLAACKEAEDSYCSRRAWSPEVLEGFNRAFALVIKEQTPGPQDAARRRQILEKMGGIVGLGLDGHTELRVEPYGSFVSGLYAPTGDLDISIEGFCGKEGRGRDVRDMGKSAKAALLRALSKKLERSRLHRGYIQRILHARVPILKLVWAESGIPCDVSVGSSNSRFKAEVVKALVRLDGRFEQMLRVIKVWSGAHGLNDASNGTFNTFALSLMVLFHLQLRRPAVLPPLHELFRDAHDATFTRPLHLGQEISPGMLEAFQAAAEATPRSGNDESVAELLASFFARFAAATTRWQRAPECCDVRASTWCGAWSYRPWAKAYMAAVEDPFDSSDNCARTIGRDRLPYITRCFADAADAMMSARDDKDLAATAHAPPPPPPSRLAPPPGVPGVHQAHHSSGGGFASQPQYSPIPYFDFPSHGRSGGGIGGLPQYSPIPEEDGKTPSGALRKILKVKRGGPAGEAPPAFSPLPQYSSSPAYDQTGSNTLRQMLNIGRTAPEAGSSGGGNGAYSGIDRGNGGIGSHRSAYSGTGLSGAYSGNGLGGASSGTGKSRAARSGGVGGNAAASGSGGGSYGLPDSLDLAMGSLDIGSHASPAPAPAPAPVVSNANPRRGPGPGPRQDQTSSLPQPPVNGDPSQRRKAKPVQSAPLEQAGTPQSLAANPARKGRGKNMPTAPNQGVHPAGPQSSGASANGAADSNEGATKKPRPRNKWKVCPSYPGFTAACLQMHQAFGRKAWWQRGVVRKAMEAHQLAAEQMDLRAL
ncbi:hypothetical protein COCSUDRAFT_41642 [Coccomyxa subellipsoidea C-169]|uniref:Poly(A) RNA polymerase mitochondrial-like central palm domain-containing protein n=1 Tax=Coccomyxa subellipsoidea (strain C-169) TaxID=574566 RepID=I0YYB6_COCSC|nr:hypothetical protein COCSUDRAFT_41642 [Coccomyxa subellipsoidea C-169]EIE23385.1 hypothetical protein COCSUDRAFT_41642 [Coccomyxa subellipsoidea C-169]|eukprot:XP_005647929.1 hypothetical protein COCSUDRAFT_41642 [Coccomyxa subellipsoidea C-169]